MNGIFGGRVADQGPSTRRPRHRAVEFDGNLVTTHAADDEDFERYIEELRTSVTVTQEAEQVERVTMEEAGLYPELLENLKKHLKYKGFLPLQEVTVPVLTHKTKINLLVQSPTGSGKTAAFGIPAVQLAMRRKRDPKEKKTLGPSVIIMCNTMNLAVQIKENLVMIAGGPGSNNTGVNVFGLFNGGDDKMRLRKGADIDIIVATMGSLVKCIERNTIETSTLQAIILDEADKMVNMTAFGQDVEHVITTFGPEVMNRVRVAAFSATYASTGDGSIAFEGTLNELFGGTIPSLVYIEPVKGYINQRIVHIRDANESLRDVNLAAMPPKERTRLLFAKSAHAQKVNYLTALLDKDKEMYYKDGKFTKTAIVFVERIITCNFLCTYLLCMGYKVLPLNSNYDLVAVKDALKKMANGEVQALISTNKMARGQDVPDLHHVIVYEMSSDFDDYKHRIGRTGRIGHGGIATAFFNPIKDGKHIVPLYEFMEYHNQTIPRWLYDGYRMTIEHAKMIQKTYGNNN